MLIESENKPSSKSVEETKSFPDIAKTVPTVSGTLQRVGMEHVELPIKIRNHQSEVLTLPAIGNFYISLDRPDVKGIHMSRLYLVAQRMLQDNEVSHVVLSALLEEMVDSHAGLSMSAALDLSFDFMIERAALISDKKGWRFYPVTFSLTRDAARNLTLDTTVRIAYSSTCPCSAALARQLIQAEFLRQFDSKKNIDIAEVHAWLGREQGQVATPHSQRSYADVTVRFSRATETLDLLTIIDLLETAVATPVQSAVKREDEQEFARLNASNLMFSEDAARRLQSALEQEPQIIDYKIHVEHIESLHPHNAVVITTKGVVGGLQ